MTINQAFDRATVVRTTALLLACVMLAGFALRVVVAGHIDPLATGIGVGCAGFLIYLRYLVGQGVSVDTAAVVVMALTIGVYAVLSWTSHGYLGSIIFAAPMLPLIASLLLDRRGVRNVTIIVMAILLFILAQQLSGNLQGDENFPPAIRFSMRALILLISLVGATWVVDYYQAQRDSAEVKPRLEDSAGDTLTGLLNRDVIDQALERECARARRAEAWISLALIEIDDYQKLVSEHGSHGAENCLLGTADGLRYCMRRSADALGRFSPSKLCILMSDTDDSGGERVAEKFRQLMETLDIPLVDSRTILLTVSVGVASCKGRDLAGLEQLVDAAGQALVEAQQAGGNHTRVKTLEPDDAGETS
jgi:diguanylate cyclase (GGDEF)-like protein